MEGDPKNVLDRSCVLIEAIKGFPLLYSPHGSITARAKEWKLLAEQTNFDESFLKNRWHIMRDNYRLALKKSQGKPVKFKYHAQLSFLQPQLLQSIQKAAEEEERERLMPDKIIAPEFILDKEDIERDNGDEQYVFLEIDANNTNAEEFQTVVYEPERQQQQHHQEQQQQQAYNTIVFDPVSCIVQNGSVVLDQSQQQIYYTEQNEFVEVVDVETTEQQVQHNLEHQPEVQILANHTFCIPQVNVKVEEPEVISMEDKDFILNDQNEFIEEPTFATETLVRTDSAHEGDAEITDGPTLPAKRVYCEDLNVQYVTHEQQQQQQQQQQQLQQEQQQQQLQQEQQQQEQQQHFLHDIEQQPQHFVQEQNQVREVDVGVPEMYEQVVEEAHQNPTFSEILQAPANVVPPAPMPSYGYHERLEDNAFCNLIEVEFARMPPEKKRILKQKIMALVLS